MFSPSFARALRSTGSASTVPVSSLCRAALATNPTPFRPSHQRRYSSSKSSIPPSSKKKSGEELERNAATQLQGKQADAKPIDKVTEIPLAISTNNAPHVSPTTHRHGDDVRLSSFFALHHPLPFHRDAWQQPCSMEAFEAFFDGANSNNAWQPSEEVIKLHASQLPHFMPPAPPVAFDPSAPQSDAFTAQEISAAINECTTEVALPSEQKKPLTTFQKHVRRRRSGGMLLISVKRQRKLKMKKHKYKKLMKRTRLERRKLDRL